jgi:hypothetical protein
LLVDFTIIVLQLSHLGKATQLEHHLVLE